MDVARDLAIILRELWDKVVSPIVNFLQTMGPLRSHIWWCPTAELSLFPLYAAGPYRISLTCTSRLTLPSSLRSLVLDATISHILHRVGNDLLV